MKYEFVEMNRSSFRVMKMCLVLKVSLSGYYAWRSRGRSNREIANEQLLSEIEEVYHKVRGIYGSPRITAELHDRGYHCGENRVAMLMKKNGIAARTRKKFKVTTQSKHKQSVAANLLEGDFTTDGRNEVWVSDITYIWTREGWLYLAAVMDLYSRQIVGWSMSNRISAELVINALQQAIWRRCPGFGLIIHSDRGIQYASHAFRNLLKDHKFIQSMSSKGNCYDNAVMESFFHTLKVEHIYFESYQTRTEAKDSIFEYIEIFYNRVRKHSSISYMSPSEYEALPITS